MTYNDRLTCESADGSHYWSGHTKPKIAARLAQYENYGLPPGRVGHIKALLKSGYDYIKEVCDKCEYDRLTWNGSIGKPGSSFTKAKLIDRLAEYEDSGLSPAELGQFLALATDKSISIEDALRFYDAHCRK